jgi:hypothetical protein
MKIFTYATIAVLVLTMQTSFAQAVSNASPNSADTISKEEEHRQLMYHSQIITFAPIQFTENGVGFGIGYERALDKTGIVAFVLPSVLTFSMGSADNNNMNSEPAYDPMFYLMPGIKFYPMGSREHVTYGVGAHLVMGGGTSTTYNDYSVKDVRTRYVLGTIINNSLNINQTKHFYLGLELGLGFTYLHVLDGNTSAVRFLTQGGFKIGYRL